MTPALKGFLDRVVVPALVDRFVSETRSVGDDQPSLAGKAGSAARGQDSNDLTSAGTALSAPGGVSRS